MAKIKKVKKQTKTKNFHRIPEKELYDLVLESLEMGVYGDWHQGTPVEAKNTYLDLLDDYLYSLPKLEEKVEGMRIQAAMKQYSKFAARVKEDAKHLLSNLSDNIERYATALTHDIVSQLEEK